MTLSPTRRAVHTLSWLISATIAAACFGGGRTAKPVAVQPPVTKTDSSVAAISDSAKRAAADSVQRALVQRAAGDTSKDSTKSRVADSSKFLATKDSAAKKPVRKAAPAAKQCVLDFTNTLETRAIYQRLPDSTSLTFIGGGVVANCQGEKNQIRADSAEQFQASGVLNLIGNVVYEEPNKIRIESQHATYFTKEQRLLADGNVVATQLSSGSQFRGISIDYLRSIPGTRPNSRLFAPNRPTVRLLEKDSLGKAAPPILVTGDNMVDEADSLLYVWGNVQVVRNALVGESDSASFNKQSELARMIRNARVTNREKDEPFRLSGDTVDMFSKNRKLERVVALHNGNASNNDVVMQSERLDLFFNEQKLDKAYASGEGRSKATTSTQFLEADSLYIRMPDQRVREVKAIGDAIATGKPDTLKIKSNDRDVLRGDTVSAWFDSTQTPNDTTQRARMREVHAIGNASSFFQIPNKLGPTAPASLNYVRGKIIHVVFDSGQVRDVTVDSAASGLYLEPVPDSLKDSTKAKVAPAVKPKVPPQPAPRPPRDPSVHNLALLDPRRRS